MVGIVALAAAALTLTATVNGARFAAGVRSEARPLWSTGEGAPPALQPADLAALPPPVRRHLERSGALARPQPVRAARLRHGGTFRPKPDGPWMPIRGEQYFAADPPGFVWWGRTRVAPGLWIDARDRSMRGEGTMRIRIESTVPIGDARGAEIDQGALTRLLGEMVWLPTALADPRHVTWSARDDSSARAALEVGGREVVADFHFGPDGLPRGVTIERFRDLGNGKAVITPWTGELNDYRLVDGLRVPFRIEGAWLLESGRFPYARFTVERIELDRPEPF